MKLRVAIIRPVLKGWIGAVLLCAAADAEGFAVTTTTELQVAADFDGDGLTDAVVADGATGGYRVGYQAAGGDLAWAVSRASGGDRLTGLSAGRLVALNFDSLVFSSPEANRMQIVSANVRSTAGIPDAFFIDGAGPNLSLAIDIGGAAPTPHDDLFVASCLNADPFRLTLLRDNGAVAGVLQDGPVASRFERGNAVVLKTGRPPSAAVIARGATDALQVFDVGGAATTLAVRQPGLPPGTDYSVGQFTATPYPGFLFWQAGGSNFIHAAVEEPVPVAFGLRPGVNWSVPGPVQFIATFTGPNAGPNPGRSPSRGPVRCRWCRPRPISTLPRRTTIRASAANCPR